MRGPRVPPTQPPCTDLYLSSKSDKLICGSSPGAGLCSSMIGGEYIGDWIKETLGGRGDLNAQEGHVPVGSRGAEALNPGRGWGMTYNVYSSHLGMF